jgi:hypothetical protein
MNAREILEEACLPWLELKVSFDHERMIEEARGVAGGFVRHRDGTSRGWKGLWFHGLGPRHTNVATSYGFSDEVTAPYRRYPSIPSIRGTT